MAFFSAGIGAFAGSYFAFLFRKHKEEQINLKKRKSALDACLFTLARQYNALYQIKETYDAFPEIVERAISMPAIKFPEYKDVRIDFDSLNFLSDIEKIAHPLNLTTEQERFEAALRSVEIRAKFHAEKLQPAIEQHNINGRELSGDELEIVLGELLFNTAINYVQYTYRHLYDSLISIDEIHQKTWKIAKSLFPEKNSCPQNHKWTNLTRMDCSIRQNDN
ncbi:hypothetical protein J1G34_25910 [Pseudomonas sp. Wu6]|uniref:hypothetical protein n=1 Tax=Pseudomonas sp. Wu6 TaxID=1210129 RepID=UPI001CA63671|nr:hypothetical protein [Pseudomonas sp. Wu6]MBY8932481.1 hypothetical protein [Pseudomonas sp. Wu6]